jgi:hypothetical protein
MGPGRRSADPALPQEVFVTSARRRSGNKNKTGMPLDIEKSAGGIIKNFDRGPMDYLQVDYLQADFLLRTWLLMRLEPGERIGLEAGCISMGVLH